MSNKILEQKERLTKHKILKVTWETFSDRIPGNLSQKSALVRVYKKLRARADLNLETIKIVKDFLASNQTEEATQLLVLETGYQNLKIFKITCKVFSLRISNIQANEYKRAIAFKGNQGEIGLSEKTIEIIETFLSNNEKLKSIELLLPPLLEFPQFKPSNGTAAIKSAQGGTSNDRALLPASDLVPAASTPASNGVKPTAARLKLFLLPLLVVGASFLAYPALPKFDFSFLKERIYQLPQARAINPTKLNYLKNTAASEHFTLDRLPKKLAVRGDLVAIASQERLIVANIRTFQELEQIALDLDGPPTAIALSSDRSKIALADPSGTVRIYDRSLNPTSPKQHRIDNFDNNAPLVSLAFTADNFEIIVGDALGTVSFVSIETGFTNQRLFGHSAAINAILVHPNGQIVTASSDRTIKVWHSVKYTKQLARKFKDSDRVTSLALDPAGNIYSANASGIIRKFSLETGKEIDTYAIHTQDIDSIDVAGTLLVAGTTKGTSFVLDLIDRSNKQIFNDFSNQVAISPDGKTILGVNNDATVWQNHQ